MAFALFLAAGGFVNEYLNSQMRNTLKNLRVGIGDLIDLKEGKVARLKRLEPASPDYVALVNEIQTDLENLDGKLREQLAR